MEIIGVILFILFFVVSIRDSKKKRASNAAKPGASAGARRPSTAAAAKPGRSSRRSRPAAPTSTIPRSLDDIKGAMNQWLEDAMDEIRSDEKPSVQPAARAAQGASMLDDPECAGGSMPHTHAEGHSSLADEDCAGGSMEHTHTEGVSRTVQARRMAAIDADHDDSAVRPETIDARALRRAVVMAEVLGKPRAMRKF